MSINNRELPLSPDQPPAAPKRRRTYSRAPSGRYESPDQLELFDDLPHLREFSDDDDDQHDQQDAG